MTTSPFHAGERAAQRWAGVPPSSGAFIRDHMPEQHRELFEKLPFILVGSVDDTLQPHASLLAGEPGFIRTQSDVLEVRAPMARSETLQRDLRRGARLGILGIEPHTRRRNRVNGYVLEVTPESFTLSVEQSFGNCPKYITPRKLAYAPTGANSTVGVSALTRRERDLISTADTFFVASAHPQAHSSADSSHGVDVSHRGGPSGFIRFTDEDTFVITDFKGNNLFNTFGNILENPKVGLLFWDLDARRVLQLTANAELKHRIASESGETERLLEFRSSGGVWLEGGCPLEVATVL